MPRVLLTGIAGFIGAHIVEHLQATTDWDIVGIASFRHMGDPLRSASFDPERVRIYTADLTAPLSGRLVDLIGEVDYVINAAAESHVDRSITEPRHFIENNVSVAVTMLEYARLVRPDVFIQVSTDEVYGPAPAGVDFPEWSDLVPSNPYSASKAAQEMIAIAYWRTYGVPVVITNTMNNFGERQDPEKFVPLVINKICRGEEIGIHGSPEFVGSRSYLHARNHADAIRWLIDNVSPPMYLDGATRPMRVNVVGDREVDNLEMVRLIGRYVRVPYRWRWDDYQLTRPGHDLRYALDGTKLEEMGWRPPVPFEESLKRTVEWTLRHPEWLR